VFVVTKGVYEIVLLGTLGDIKRGALQATLSRLLQEFNLSLGKQVVLSDASSFNEHRTGIATVGLFFGGNPEADSQVIDKLVKFSIPTIPVLEVGMKFEDSVPLLLASTNGIIVADTDADLVNPATAALECLGLLREQRRVFVSYRRSESRSAAVQLHDVLSGVGYDVFLDTHDIRRGDQFQDELWHRLCDSDVLVMLDTPEYFERKWTRMELAKAQAKEIHILRIVWPDHKPTRKTDVGQAIFLEKKELLGPDGPIAEPTIDQITLAIEVLRSNSIAARYLSITGKLRAEAKKVDATVHAIGANRSIGIRLESGKQIWAYPVVGIPSAATLNDIVEKSILARQAGHPVLVYDHVGIRSKWAKHIDWLNDQIGSVDAIKVSQAAWDLAEMEG
jgi:hypothetical protein